MSPAAFEFLTVLCGTVVAMLGIGLGAGVIAGMVREALPRD